MPKGTATNLLTAIEIAQLREEGLTVPEVAARLGVSTRTVVRYAQPADESAKTRLLRAVVDHGPMADVATLCEHTPDIDRHSAMHLLFSLARGGLVGFREEHTGTRLRLRNIEATQRGRDAIAPDPTPPEPTNGEAKAAVEAAEDWLATARASVEEPGWPTVPACIAIRAEIDRRANIEEAAAALERAGLVDLAISALAEVDGTRLVNEALALYRATVLSGLVVEEV